MGLELADIFRKYPVECSNSEQARAVAAIRDCRTAELGGHLQECNHCGHVENFYNSCRSRHCPKCQSLARAEWVEKRRAELLPIPYYHIVFTMPHELAAIALQNQKQLYELLFWTSAQALQEVAANPKYLGAQVGLVSVLHTWCWRSLSVAATGSRSMAQVRDKTKPARFRRAGFAGMRPGGRCP